MKSIIMQRFVRAGVILYCVVLAAFGNESRAATWTGTSADWNNLGSWTGGVPNATGAVADFDTAPTESISTTIAADPVTVGSVNYGNSSNIGDFSWTISNFNGLTLNQDDAGSDNAKITNSNTNAGAINYLFIDSGTLTLADSLRVVNSSASTADNGAIQIGSVIAGTGAVTLRSEQAIDPNMSLSQARGAIRLTAANTYVGTTTIEKGLVVFTNTTAFGTDAANVITLGNAAAPADNVALGFQATSTAAGSNIITSRPIVVEAGTGSRTIAILPDLAANTYTVTYSGAITLNSDLTLYNPDTVTGVVTPVDTGTVAVGNFTGTISGTGGVKKTGDGIIFLNVPGGTTSSYSGDTVVESGFLVSGNTIPNGAGKGNVIVNSGGTYSISGNETINGLSGSGTIRPYSGTTVRTLTIGDNDQSSLFSGVIGNTRIDTGAAGQELRITKTGTGTLTLSGANTYTGTTTVNAGKLIVNGTHTGTSIRVYEVNATGTLGGEGTIARNINVTGGTLAPGDVVVSDTVGTLTIGGLTLNDGSHGAFELNPTNTTLGAGINDYLDIVGALTVTGAPTIHIDISNAVGGGNLSTAINRTWTLASYDSLAGGGTPTFNITGTIGGSSLAIVPDDTVNAPFGPGTIQLTVNASVAGVPGDYNNNGTVDAADYVLWRKGGPLQNEVDTPNTVNEADYTAWRARFGNTSGSGASLSTAAVPEPAGCLLMGMCLLLFCGQRGARSNS
jgi:fibronectin-binding autotransporter adhesin